MLNTKSLKVLHRKGISMLTGLKVSSLTCKFVFYRPELNAKAEPIELNLQALKRQWVEPNEYKRKIGSFV